MLNRIIIEKEDQRSKMIGDVISVYVDTSEATDYVNLLKKTFPRTTINNYADAQKRFA